MSGDGIPCTRVETHDGDCENWYSGQTWVSTAVEPHVWIDAVVTPSRTDRQPRTSVAGAKGGSSAEDR